MISYYMRDTRKDRAFHTCTLTKTTTNTCFAKVADPLPNASDALDFYKMTVIKRSGQVSFYIGEMPILEYKDDGMTYGDILTGGKIGFYHGGGLKALYRNLKVTWI